MNRAGVGVAPPDVRLAAAGFLSQTGMGDDRRAAGNSSPWVKPRTGRGWSKPPRIPVLHLLGG
jgi:hypothetical protein